MPPRGGVRSGHETRIRSRFTVTLYQQKVLFAISMYTATGICYSIDNRAALLSMVTVGMRYETGICTIVITMNGTFK